MTPGERKWQRIKSDPVLRSRVKAQYKAWYERNGRTPERIAKAREAERRRRADPTKQPSLKEAARRYREKYRVQRLAYHAINRAKHNGLACDEDYMRALGYSRPTNCPCCGIVLNYAYSGTGKEPLYNGPSLDRVDTLKGYVAGNVEIICWRCNALKRDSTLKELEQIVQYMRKRLCGQ